MTQSWGCPGDRRGQKGGSVLPSRPACSISPILRRWQLQAGSSGHRGGAVQCQGPPASQSEAGTGAGVTVQASWRRRRH